MVRIEGEIVIDRPVEEVFDFVADERNEPRFNPQMRRAEKISDGPIGRGTRFRAEMVSMGRPVQMDIVRAVSGNDMRAVSGQAHQLAIERERGVGREPRAQQHVAQVDRIGQHGLFVDLFQHSAFYIFALMSYNNVYLPRYKRHGGGANMIDQRSSVQFVQYLRAI